MLGVSVTLSPLSSLELKSLCGSTPTTFSFDVFCTIMHGDKLELPSIKLCPVKRILSSLLLKGEGLNPPFVEVSSRFFVVRTMISQELLAKCFLQGFSLDVCYLSKILFDFGPHCKDFGCLELDVATSKFISMVT